ncbi:hypothetical protein PAL_GLEAN10003068 [Pteropus alecto]|uniref:Uncharacterized protein n=1 Tax=Pteropus alecto TaxID=9402 RepID=L5KEG1_PTEAL|nr:hypothetical protein PAL_GLEAN10003068 [Pteropus alecto]
MGVAPRTVTDQVPKNQDRQGNRFSGEDRLAPDGVLALRLTLKTLHAWLRPGLPNTRWDPVVTTLQKYLPETAHKKPGPRGKRACQGEEKFPSSSRPEANVMTNHLSGMCHVRNLELQV